MADGSKIKEELKHLRKDDGELKRIKGLIKADGRLSVHDLSSIEQKFVKPATPEISPYHPGERSLQLVDKGAKGSRIRSLIKKEGEDLSRLKDLIVSRRRNHSLPTAKEVSIKQIERLESTKLAELERQSKIVDQKLSSSLEPGEPAGKAEGGPAAAVQGPERSQGSQSSEGASLHQPVPGSLNSERASLHQPIPDGRNSDGTSSRQPISGSQTSDRASPHQPVPGSRSSGSAAPGKPTPLSRNAENASPALQSSPGSQKSNSAPPLWCVPQRSQKSNSAPPSQPIPLSKGPGRTSPLQQGSASDAHPAGGQALPGEKSNLNPAAIPLSLESSGHLPQAGKTAVELALAKVKDAAMAKEEAVDNRPLGEIIAEEEARDKEKLAKEMEKEAAEDAKKAAAGDKKDAKPAGKFAALLGRIIPHPAKKPEPAPQQAGAQAQPAAAAPAQPTPAVPVQAGAPGQPQVILVPQFPQMTAAPGKVTVQEEVDLRKLTMDVEKLGAEFSALKETKTQSDERLQRIAEDVGELRSLFFQREEAFRETQSTAEKLKSAVEDIEPDKFLKALHKGESEIMILQSKAEKFEHIFEESGKQMKDMRNVLENVKGIENLKELLKEINAKSSKVEEMHGSIERSTGKVEKLYVEVDKKLGEFNTFKAKVIALDELTKELVKIVDEAKIKLDDTPNKSEFATLEKGMQDEMKQATDSLEGVKQQLVSQLSDIQSKSSEISASLENFKQESRMQVTAVQMQFDKELAELRQQALMIIDAVKEEVQRNTINIDEIRRMDSYVELDRRIREHSLPSASQPFKPQDGSAPAAVQQPFEEPKPVPRSISPSEVRDSMEELSKRKAELTRLSDFLGDEYHRGIISERSYRESMENAKSRLSEISRLMEIKGKVLKDMPHSAGADDGRDLYYSPERVKREVERETPVSRLLDVQDRFEKINGMLSVLSESRNAQGKGNGRSSASSGARSGARGAHAGAQDGAGHSGMHSEHSAKHDAPPKKQDTERILSKVKELRMSLDDKLGAARAHEHRIRQVHMEKERLKKYHPVISKPKK